MCGLVGVISFQKKSFWQERKDFMSQILFANTLRGADGTGIFAVPYDLKLPVDIYKKHVPGYDFIELKKTEKLLNNIDEYKFFIGHNRYATKGRVRYEHTHPFQIDHITLVHNGSMTWMSDYKDHSNFEVDSELLTYTIAKEGYKEAIEKYSGGCALIWYDGNNDSLNLYRNKDRPLFFSKVKGQDTIYISSELSLMKWIAIRNNIQIEKSIDVGENNMITFKNDINFEVENILPKPKPLISIVDDGDLYSSIYGQTKYNRQNYKKDAMTYLLDVGLSKGSRIEFSYSSLLFPRKESRHGKLLGTMNKHPFCLISSYHVGKNKFKGNFILEGIIVGVEPVKGVSNEFSIIVNDVKETAIKDTSYSDSSDKVLDLQDFQNTWTTVGFGGEELPLVKFKQLVQNGCVLCGDPIMCKDAKDLGWMAEDRPVCIKCKPYMAAAEFGDI